MFEELIGREHAAGVLRGQIERAVASHGGLVLVTGEAGIGKTALVTGAAEEARRLGALVLSGACWDSQSAPGYWPWVQVVRGMRRAAGAEAWAAAREAAGGALDTLLGETTAGAGHGGTAHSGAAHDNARDNAHEAGAGGGPGGSPAEPGGDSFELYDAVTTLLVTASHERPVVVILEDLHWADAASLRLLHFAAQHAWFERLLLVGTYRETEGEVEAPLAAKATTVGLTGLDASGVAALIARTTGREPDAGLAAEVHRRTGGNPFFVEQTARLWQSRAHGPDALTAIPPGVRDTVRRRLSLLPPPVAELLTGAAVLGREFHRSLLAAVQATPVPEVNRLLDQAVAARLVTPLGAGRFAFAHDLVRETLYEELEPDAAEPDGAGERARRHAAVVRALDRQPVLVERCGVLPAELARHARLAGGGLPPARAFELLRAAATDAGGRMAFEEAAGHLRRAYELAAGVHPKQRMTTGLTLALELHHLGGEDAAAEAWRVYEEVVAEARALDDVEVLARVALSLYQAGYWLGSKAGDGHRRLTSQLLREASGRLGYLPTPDASNNELARELTVRSEALARRGADDDALGFSLSARHDAIWGLGTAAERETITDEMIAVARRTQDRDLEHFGMSLRWVALLEQGDPRYLEQFLEFVAVVESLGVPRYHFSSAIDQCIIATLHGRFEEAEELQRQAMEMGDHADDHHEHFAFFGIHLRWAMLLLQGRFGELDELHAAPTTRRLYRNPEMIAGITAAQRGDAATAIRLHAEIAARDSEPPRSVRPLWLRLQAQAAAASKDPVLCERVRAALAPYAEAGAWAVSMWGFDVSGPMVLWAAEVDAAEERWDAAVAGFAEAARAADRLGARPWSVEARARLARALAARAGPGDAAAAAALANDVAHDAEELGMRHLLGDAPNAQEPAVAEATVEPQAGAGAEAEKEFRFDGTVWSLRFAGRLVHMPDAKGLRDLHRLLASPGTDIPAAELASPEGDPEATAARRMGGDPVLDEEAKARYRAHLTRLDEEIDRATGLGDDERAARLDAERAALLAELRAAAGLGGRTRRLGDEAERARKTVTARIRDTLRRLDQRHPELAAHLRAAVSTGTHCAYRPDAATDWRL
ncbi:ATP-binding protein [Streptomyces sp. 6N223]|uniref:ATP-binding protein n=1 Tax=Streptomyces sp. 6N223 TaxID=3457412 RepID=UPI003FD580F1